MSQNEKKGTQQKAYLTKNVVWRSLDLPDPRRRPWGFCNCSMFCCALLYFHSSFAIILMGKRELVAFLSLSSWCLVIFVWFFLVIVGFLDHTHLLFLIESYLYYRNLDLFMNESLNFIS